MSKDPLAELAQLWRSPAIPSFIARRIDQVVKHGHSPEADLTAPTDRLVRAAKDRICAALDKLGGIGGAGDDLPYALAKIEIAGACLMAAHDQLSAIKAARG